MTFKVGEVVVLKSGGPPMTVEQSQMDVECVWFNKADEGNRSTFIPEVLRIYEPPFVGVA
ncbi:MAG: YodC family protein [Terriglobia bacterium]